MKLRIICPECRMAQIVTVAVQSISSSNKHTCTQCCYSITYRVPGVNDARPEADPTKEFIEGLNKKLGIHRSDHESGSFLDELLKTMKKT